MISYSRKIVALYALTFSYHAMFTSLVSSLLQGWGIYLLSYESIDVLNGL